MTVTDPPVVDEQAAPPTLTIRMPLGTYHVGDDECPWVVLTEEVDTKVPYVNLKEGLWVVRNRMKPGTSVQTHRHTGQVLAFTLSGTWYYEESPEQVNRAGSFLLEPAGSTHTLKVPADAELTDVWFAIWGANLNLDKDGNIESVLDAATMLAVYEYLCELQGVGAPKVLVDE